MAGEASQFVPAPSINKLLAIHHGDGIDRFMDRESQLSWLLVATAALVVGYLFYALYFIFG